MFNAIYRLWSQLHEFSPFSVSLDHISSGSQFMQPKKMHRKIIAWPGGQFVSSAARGCGVNYVPVSGANLKCTRVRVPGQKVHNYFGTISTHKHTFCPFLVRSSRHNHEWRSCSFGHHTLSIFFLWTGVNSNLNKQLYCQFCNVFKNFLSIILIKVPSTRIIGKNPLDFPQGKSVWLVCK